MRISLEDEWTDVVSKALAGKGLAVAAFTDLREGRWNEAEAAEVCRLTGLNFSALRDLALGRAHPGEVVLPDGLMGFVSHYGDMMVNAYLAVDERDGRAVAFDTGADAAEMLHVLRARGWRLELLLLTHTHGDHVFEMDRIVEQTGCAVWVHERERLEGAGALAGGQRFKVGRLEVRAVETPGHSPGGTSYHVDGLALPVTVTGDALFAASAGKIRENYRAALEAVREEILNRPPETVLCPGHGPVSTVGWEKKHNPFFA